ncbi:peptidase M23 [Microbacterium dextranolyticum]|uniref:Peptidase M23 n=1 Tax=Microbacterium dextranolyticum TaxID=36806 RepID=A0A9W6HIR5_9MICO|nr:peptidase M23 [Microbacterium dextranolyticum]MBM7461784.1 hypothetical protein [Microbacterium dextranolyticum]GLJ94025.1 hypothetical protein GCM10017591_00860 [Microbacterium dextranolyticum]
MLRARRAVALAIGAVLAVAAVVGVIALAQASAAAARCEVFTAYDAAQLDNARTIMAVGRADGLPIRDQAIAVMTAMGESSLRNLDYGDWETSGVTNPDGTATTSLGLFQQQNGWGTREQRLDPATAAALFYRAMIADVPEPERSTLEPTDIAHRVQINRDPDHYAKFWPSAEHLVTALSDETFVDSCR